METRLALVPGEWDEYRLPAEELTGEMGDEELPRSAMDPP
jgi:hypothetical protein